MISRPN